MTSSGLHVHMAMRTHTHMYAHASHAYNTDTKEKGGAGEKYTSQFMKSLILDAKLMVLGIYVMVIKNVNSGACEGFGS